MKNWYLLKTKFKQEITAVTNLENQNYYVYCPWASIDNKKQFLFPGYLFIQIDEKIQNWSPIRSTKGVMNFVRFGMNFAKVPDSVIDLIKENENSTVKTIKKFSDFKQGDKVQISEGAFKNCIAIFHSIKSDDRVLLFLKMMGQDQSINVGKKSVIRL